MGFLDTLSSFFVTEAYAEEPRAEEEEQPEQEEGESKEDGEGEGDEGGDDAGTEGGDDEEEEEAEEEEEEPEDPMPKLQEGGFTYAVEEANFPGIAAAANLLSPTLPNPVADCP